MMAMTSTWRWARDTIMSIARCRAACSSSLASHSQGDRSSTGSPISKCTHVECTWRRAGNRSVRVICVGIVCIVCTFPLKVGIVIERSRLRVDVAHPSSTDRGALNGSHGQARARSPRHCANPVVAVKITTTAPRVEVVVIIIQRGAVESSRCESS